MRSVRWKRSILPVVVGLRGLRQQVLDAILAADPVEQDFDRRQGEPPREHLAVVGQHLLGNAVPAERAGEAVADQLGPLARHQRRRDAVPRVVVDPGQCLGGRAVAEQEATDDVHLPQLHRAAPLPALPHLASTLSRDRLDHARSNQTPVHRGLRRRGIHPLLGQLERQAPRAPVRPGSPHLEDRCLERGGHLV